MSSAAAAATAAPDLLRLAGGVAVAPADIVRSGLAAFGGDAVRAALVELVAMHTARDHQDEDKRDRADADVHPLIGGETEKGPLALAVTGGQLTEIAIIAAFVCGGECANPQ